MKNSKKIFIVLFVVLNGTALSQDFFLTKTSSVWIEKFALFEGTWKQKGTTTFENWILTDSLLSGKMIHVENTDTVLLEELSIKNLNDTIYYVATVMNQNNKKPVLFKLISQNHTIFHFQNPDHDFPKEIIYIFHNQNKLTSTISGAGKKINFEFTRIN